MKDRFASAGTVEKIRWRARIRTRAPCAGAIRNLLATLCIGSFMAHSPCARAELNYYNNVIVGDRAAGLGGAFAGIADDASGVVYNPAGLAFSLSDTVSGSANAYYMKRTTYEDIVGDSDFEEKSQGYFPSFIGGLKRLDSVSKNLAAGFAIYASDYEFKDQDDFIRDPAQRIESFHRTVNRRASTLHIAFGVAKRVVDNVSVGLGLGVALTDEIAQEYQDSAIRLDLNALNLDRTPAGSNKGDIYRAISSNQRSRLQAYGFEPALGIQAMFFDALSLGIMARTTFYFSQSLEVNVDATTLHHYPDFSIVQPGDLVRPDDAEKASVARFEEIASGKIDRVTPSREYSRGAVGKARYEDPFDNGPTELRAGAAYFVNTRLLLAADATHHLPVASAFKDLRRNAVTNVHVGCEYYMTPSFPMRLGLFTNNDARDKPDAGNAADERVNYVGSSLFFAWALPNSQIGAGATAQAGRGKARKIRGDDSIQDVRSWSATLLLSATHSM